MSKCMQHIWSFLVSRFLAEFKKYIHFFGLCGVVIALLMLWPGVVFNQVTLRIKIGLALFSPSLCLLEY